MKLKLSTQIIWITMIFETIALLLGGLLFSSYIRDERIQWIRNELYLQSGLIAERFTSDVGPGAGLAVAQNALDSSAGFQVIDGVGTVLWDSRHPDRIHQFAPDDHPLLREALRGKTQKGFIEFTNPTTHEIFLGVFQRVQENLYILGAYPLQRITLQIQTSLDWYLKIALLLLGVSLVLSVWFTRQILRPIQALSDASTRIADGNFDVQLNSSNSTESASISAALATLIKRVQLLLAGEAQKSRIEEEVNIAAEIQAKLLPPLEIKSNRFEIQSFYQSATETGGDYWGYTETQDSLILYVGDVTGHGLPSALLTAGVRGCFSALSHHYQNEIQSIPTPSEILHYANQAVMDMGAGEIQMTLFVAVLDLNTRMMKYSNSGHPPAWILRGTNSDHPLEILQARGPRLGETKVFVAGEVAETQLHLEDSLFIYTDGLFDCKNSEGTELGKSAVKELLVTKDAMKTPLSELKTAIEFKLFQHLQGNPPDDDITFCMVRIS